MNNRLKVSSKEIFAVVIFFSIVRFHPSFVPDAISVYWFDLVVIPLCLFWMAIEHIKIKGSTKELFWLFFLVSPFMFLPALFAEYFVGYFVNLLRFVFYFIYLIFFLMVIEKAKPSVPFLVKIIDYSFLVVFLICLIQLFAPPILTDLIHLAFGDDKLRSIWQGYPRLYGTYYNANWFAVYLLFVLTIWVNYFLIYKKNIIWITYRLLPLIVLLFFSGSRSGIIVSVFILVASFLFFRHSVKRVLLYTFGITLLSGFTLYIFDLTLSWFELDRLIGRFNVLVLLIAGDFQSDISLMGRFESQMRAIELIKEKPFLGYGDRPGILVPHNSILTLLLSFGFVGSISITLFSLIIVIKALIVKTRTTQDIFFKRCFIFFSIGLGVLMMAADFVYTSQVMFLWLLITALTIGANEYSYTRNIAYSKNY